MEGMAPKPEDIPANPYQTYKDQGWQGFGDWLGTGAIANFNKKYRSFEEARKFVHTLQLKNQKEWSQYCKGEMDPKPEDKIATNLEDIPEGWRTNTKNTAPLKARQHALKLRAGKGAWVTGWERAGNH